MKKINWRAYALEIIELIGGKENIQEIYHCATRLRFILKDDEKFKLDEIKKTELFKGYKKQENQHQIIIGAGVVDKVYKEIDLIVNENSSNTGDLKPENKQIFWNKKLSTKSNMLMISKRGMNSFASIFVPLVPVFIAGGMSLAIMSLVNQISPNTGFAKLLDVIGGGIMGSIPVFVGYTAAKKWGGNPFLGMAIGLVLVSPALLNRYSTNTPIQLGFDINTPADIIQKFRIEALHKYFSDNNLTEPENVEIMLDKIVGVYYTIFSGFFKIKLIGYQAQIVPVLLVIGLSVNIEKVLKRWTPQVVAIIVVPLGTVILSSWLAFWAIAPLGEIIGKGISLGLSGLFKYTNWNFIGFGGMIFAGFYPFLVITGLHQGFLPIETQLLVDSNLQFGHSLSFITPVACVSNIAQGTAALMLVFYTKDKTERSKAISSTFGGYTGITEPAMFGINLQIKPLFISAAIGSAIAGWWLGMTHTMANSLGSASWIGLVQFDWNTVETKKYFEANNIHAILTGVPMGVHITIAMLISVFATAGASALLLRTDWGKQSIKNYLNPSENQYN
ncbi:PTS transporter subunit EIIC [Mesoplasma tabanidae]|uniref:PTS system, sucrose-specific IIABC component n=1 Tax=Mesoplasma tabanidae TaxID=219745 RepID=A0A2K8P4T9_9MOLU|nr:PTS transporter subunit EIIC [Mesoplasma tabanidae]ATZ21759.1 PTS system, sucrose-specific IIABC component [Mesoplasma tabanidae]